MNLENQSYHYLNVALGANYETLKRIREKYQSWSRAWNEEKSRYPQIHPEKEWQKLASLNIHLILREDGDFPALLKEIPWPPFGLYLKGDLPEKSKVAIVGTRKATLNGKGLAKKLAQDLSSQGLVVVSGLAMGIDEAAHQGAVAAESPTLAVLATGLDKIYPAQNANLAKKILDLGGGLISEYPPGFPSYPMNFISRNRIISGLSLGIVVIEAPEKSGALATARFAIEQNREVMVVPGPASHANYIGSHKLIREGAKLVTTAEEILDELNLEFKDPLKSRQTKENSPEEQLILNVIKEIGWPASIDKISQMTNIEISKVNKIITFLTLRGILKE